MKVFLIALLLISPIVFAEQVLIKVPGMVCQMCVHGMKKNFKSVVNDPDKDVVVNLDDKTVKVNLSKKIDDKEIIKRVEDAGYNTAKITWLNKEKNKTKTKSLIK